MSAVEIVAIPEDERPALWLLLQDYIREMASYDPSIRPAEDGAYEYPWLDAYWHDATRWAFWAKAHGEIACFALVRKLDDSVTEMAEFYTRPDFRRTGVGLAFARELIARFPGAWELSEYRANTGAIAFWRKVIDGRTYTEHEYVSANGNPRIAQYFSV